MKFFIDTANLAQIKEAADMGILDGVTTNPSLMAKEGISGHDRVEKQVDARKGSNVGGGGARGFKAVATCGATHPSIDAGCEASVGAWEEHGGGRPLLFGDGVKIGGRGGAEMHRA